MAGIIQNAEVREPQAIAEGIWELNEGVGARTNPLQIPFIFGTLANPSSNPPDGDTSAPLDIPYTITAPSPVFRYSKALLHSRMYVQELRAGVFGITPWAGGTGVAIQDTSAFQNVLAFLPTNALGNCSFLALPAPQTIVSLQATVSSYVASTGVMTFPASTFITTTLQNYPYRVVGGTGAMICSGIVKSNTATTITPNAVPNTVLDATSVVEFPYWVASAGAGTTITASNGTFPGSNALAAGGYWVVIVGGTGAGQARLITANTATQLTVATWTTNPDATSVFMITSNPAMQGVYDCGIGGRWPIINKGPQGSPGVGVGISAMTYGTFSQGSNLRLWGRGNFG